MAKRLAARKRPKTAAESWDALSDIEVVIAVVEREIDALDGERSGRARCGRKPDPELRRRLVGLAWMVTFGGLQWRLAGRLSGIPFTTLHSAFARWARRGLWRRLGPALAIDNRIARGDAPMPSQAPIDSRSCRSAPTCGMRGIDGGKKVKGIKLHAVCDKHGSLLELELTPANVDDRAAAAAEMLGRLAAFGFQGGLLGDHSYAGRPFAAAAAAHGMTVTASPGGTRDGKFIPAGIRWTVERLFAWLSRHRRLNIIVDRAKDLLAAHVWIAMISILSRRLFTLEGTTDRTAFAAA
jgi:transposase